MYAAFHSVHVPPLDFVNLLRACCGLSSLPPGPFAASGGPLSEAWKSRYYIEPFLRYLLLLEHDEKPPPISSTAPRVLQSGDPASFYASKKLILELLLPKLEDLSELCTQWTKKTSEGGTQISLDRFQSFMSAILTGSMLIPQINDLNTNPSATMESTLLTLAERSLGIASDAVEPQGFIDSTLRLVRTCVPRLSTASLMKFNGDNRGLLHLLSKICDVLERQEARQALDDQTDLMDIDQEFESQNSRASITSSPMSLPRVNRQLHIDAKVFYADTRHRLAFLRLIEQDEGHIGMVPDHYISQLLSLADEELLSCQSILVDIFNSDLVVNPDTALNVIERLGAIVSRFEYQGSEVALTTCIEVISGSHTTWLQDAQDLGAAVGDLYNHFIKTCLPSNVFSSAAYISMVRLLLTLLRAEPEYGNNLGVQSCRTSLLFILGTGSMEVKYFISDRIAGIFELYILKLHDEVFVDILDSLPSDSENIAGIAFRLLILSRLACKWPTLLRRCTYHIFETPGQIPDSIEYATRCLTDTAKELHLTSAKELFELFSRQLLYTWLHSDSIESLPYSVFGFSTLSDLLRSAQSEATGLLIMRGQTDMSMELAQHLGISEADLIKRNFAHAMAYSMFYGDAMGGNDKGKGERHIEMNLGNKLIETRLLNFVDIIGLFFDLIDQDNPIEKTFLKSRDLAYAGNIMKAIKGISHAATQLPPNQQPMLKARLLLTEIERLCEPDVIDHRTIWTPALVTFTARRLLNTVHPALGSLHACSVLRKVRILICLAGAVALESYTLEMLLDATRRFIVDPECADDALGISQYLLHEGREYLSQVPSFVAGYALSTLASLRVFLESSQSSTTQEEQFKATMSKAQSFHNWFTQYLASYTSPVFKSPSQAMSFRSITDSAAHIRSSGNAEKGTSESKLLVDILKDAGAKERLLNESSRELALTLLCTNFEVPAHSLDDVVDSDERAVDLATQVWKSSEARDLGDNYLAWAGRVVGRYFSASGNIPDDVLRETQIARYQQIAPGSDASETGILYLLQELTSSIQSKTAGLAEAALRRTISQALRKNDEPLIAACHQGLSESLFVTCQWDGFRSPPSENPEVEDPEGIESIWHRNLSADRWLQDLSVQLARSVSQSILLSALPPILTEVKDFASKAFPFLVHLVLLFQLDHQHTAKRSLSDSLKQWLASTEPAAKDNLKLLLNTILYLRTQEYPKESSIADRSHWLELDYAQASAAADRCGMFKTALLFTELAESETARASRRSSVVREAMHLNDTLLHIFENIDDPDAYYGLPEDASLSKVLSRVEYENEGQKSLAFRGAQYDSHLRQRNPASDNDAQALVKALNTLGLSGLSHSLLQTQQHIGATPSSLDTTFRTAQRLEMWNLPAPVDSDHHAVVIYRAFQSMYQATDPTLVRTTIYDGFRKSMQALTSQGLNATNIRKRLGALAALTELDDFIHVSEIAELEGMLETFKARHAWMRSGL